MFKPPVNSRPFTVDVHKSAKEVIETKTVLAPSSRDAGFLAIRQVRKDHDLSPSVTLFAFPVRSK